MHSASARRGVFARALPLVVLLQLAPGGIVTARAAPDAGADAAFENGVELTRAGHFEQALQAFELAQAQGEDSGRLQFNLGVVYYRLARYAEARASFERAARDAETADLAGYNLGLVALAAGDREQAARHFRQTAGSAQAAPLRSLAHKALEKATGSRSSPGRGSISVLHGNDSNVVVPVGTIGDVPTAIEDEFWEARASWVDSLDTALPGLSYRLSGVAMEYAQVESANLGFAEAGVDWRGRISLGAGASALTIGDHGYQRATDLRISVAVYDEDPVRIVYEAAQSWLESLGDRAHDLDGTRLALGATVDVQGSALSGMIGVRRVINDRRTAALSPEQSLVSLRLRYARGRWAGRTWARYTDGKYTTDRHDRATEFGADLAFRLFGPCDVLIEAMQLDNRSSAAQFDYTSDRLYAGLRLRF